MNNFFINKELLGKSMMTATILDGISGVHFAFETEKSILEKIIPDKFSLKEALVLGYVIDIKNPNFAKEYKESMLGVPVYYEGRPGIYPLSLLLHGEGAEMVPI